MARYSSMARYGLMIQYVVMVDSAMAESQNEFCSCKLQYPYIKKQYYDKNRILITFIFHYRKLFIRS
jgi:hypothetical protein